jgi:hypothetical protein
MNAWGEDVGLTALLSIGIMGVGLFCLITAMSVGALLKKLTGRDNAMTRWMSR